MPPPARLPLSSPPPRQDRNRHSPSRMRKPKRGVRTGHKIGKHGLRLPNPIGSNEAFGVRPIGSRKPECIRLGRFGSASRNTKRVRSPSEKVGAAEAGSGGACFVVSQATSSALAMTGMRKVRCSPNRMFFLAGRFGSPRNKDTDYSHGSNPDVPPHNGNRRPCRAVRFIRIEKGRRLRIIGKRSVRNTNRNSTDSGARATFSGFHSRTSEVRSRARALRRPTEIAGRTQASP